MPYQQRKPKLELRKVDPFYLSPSAPFESIAQECYAQMPLATRGLMRILGLSPVNDATITSYLLFEQEYIRQLIDMGYKDAQNRQSELMCFLFD